MCKTKKLNFVEKRLQAGASHTLTGDQPPFHMSYLEFFFEELDSLFYSCETETIVIYF
jgi:hypothetical protein